MYRGHSGMPYTPRKIAIHQTSRKITSQQGVVIPIDRFAWLTDGVVRDIEKGLPLITESKLSRDFLNPDQLSIQLEQQRSNLYEGFVDSDFNDFELPPEDDSDVVDTEEHHQYRKLYSKIMRQREKKTTNPGTGIVKRPPSDDIIDNIGKINIKSVNKRKFVPSGRNPFPPPSHRPKTYKLPNERETSALVKSHMKRVFKAGTQPFKTVDRDEDFPLDKIFDSSFSSIENNENDSNSKENDLNNSNSKENDLNDSISKENYENDENDGKNDDDLDEEQHKSLLIDPKDFEIFWTRNSIPFTREEVEMLEGWKENVKDRMRKDNMKTLEILQRREKAMERTFQSRSAFDKEISLTDKAMEKAVALGPCKQQREKLSSWEVSSRALKGDHSSLQYRKRTWAKFVDQFCSFGQITCESQKKVVLEFRNLLLSGHCVNPDIFWESISVLDKMEYVSIPTMILMEFLRKVINVPEEEVVQFMKNNDFPHHFYNLALDEIEIEENKRNGKGYSIMTSRNKKQAALERIRKEQKANI